MGFGTAPDFGAPKSRSYLLIRPINLFTFAYKFSQESYILTTKHNKLFKAYFWL